MITVESFLDELGGRARLGPSEGKAECAGRGGPVTGAPQARRGVRGAEDSADGGTAARASRVEPASGRVGVARAGSLRRRLEGAANRGGCGSEEDSLTTELAAGGLSMVVLLSVDLGRVERWSPGFGRGPGVGDPGLPFLFEPAEQVVTRCLEQQAQREQEMYRHRGADSVGHEESRWVQISGPAGPLHRYSNIHESWGHVKGGPRKARACEFFRFREYISCILIIVSQQYVHEWLL